MEQDRAKAEAGWGTPGMPDARSLMADARSMMDAMQDSNLLSAMAAHHAQNGQMSQTNVPQSFGPAGNMAAGGMIGAGGMGVPGVDLPFMYPSPDNQGGEFKKAGFTEPTNPSDAQLNLKRRISQLVQMRALQQQAMFGPAGGPAPGLENNPQLFRAQAQRGDNCSGTSSPSEIKSEVGLWKSNAQKDVQFGPTSPRGGMMMPASPSPRPLSRPQSRPPSRSDGQSPQGFFPNPESPHLHQQQIQQQQQQQQIQQQQQQQQQIQQQQQQQQIQQQQQQQQQIQQQQQQQQILSQLKQHQQSNSQQFQQQHSLQHQQNSLQQFQHQHSQQQNPPQQQQSSPKQNLIQQHNSQLQHKQPMFGQQEQNIHQNNIHQHMKQQLQQQQQQLNNQSPGNQQSPQTPSNPQQLQTSQRLSNTLNLSLQGHQQQQQFMNPKFQQAQGIHQDKHGSPNIDMQQLTKGQQFQQHLQGNNHLNHFEMPNPNQGQPVNKISQENHPHLNALQHMQQQHQQKMQQQQSMQQQQELQQQHQQQKELQQHQQKLALQQQQQQALKQQQALQQQQSMQQHQQQSLHKQQQQNIHQQSLHQQQVHLPHQQQFPQQQPQPDRQQQQQHLPTSQPQDPFKKPSSQASFWNPSQGSHDKVNTNKSFPSLGTFVTTASAAVPLMSPVNGAPRTPMLDAMSGQMPKPAQSPGPQLPGMPMNMQQFDQQFPQFRTDGPGLPSSLDFNSISGDGKKAPSDDQKAVNSDKPKKVRKPKPKVEKAPNSKISDLMASDIDRKLLAMFPQYQFYLDQNTKPDEDLMPAPGVKKAKKKRPANITPEGEPKKKKKIKKKVEGESLGVISPSSPAVSKSPLLASEAAPMDTDLSRQQLEDRTVAQILAAIKEPKSAAPVAGLPAVSHSIVSANLSSVQVPNNIQSAVGQEAVKADPFDFLDDDMGSAVKPIFTKKISSQEPKESAHGPSSDQPHDESKGDKYCCNHCEVVGEVQSLHCQSKHSQSSSLASNPPGETTTVQGPQLPQDLPSTTSNSICLSSSSVQCSSAESTTVTASSANTCVASVTSGLSMGPVTSIIDSQPKDYIRDQGPQNEANPLANLQASVQSIFNNSLPNSNENHPQRPLIPPEMLKEYLDKAECNNMSKMSAPMNGLLSAKAAEFLSKNYSPPHDIKPVPPSVPSALNQPEGKTEMKPPMFSPGCPSGPERTPQTTPTQDRSKSFNMEDEELLVDDLPLKPGSAEEELLERLKNNKVEVPHCDCLGPNSIANEAVEGPYYTQLGSGPDLPSIRKMMEERLGVTGKAIRMEKIVYSGKEGKSTQGCPIAKWIIRRSGPEEKYLCVSRYRPGHFCANAFIVTNLVAWEGVPADMADDLYSYLKSTVTKLGFETERRCGTNERKTCACQGVDLIRRGASFSFGCSWSMYFNGCKYARSRDAKKFKLKDTSKEPVLESKLQDLATEVGPLYQTMAPDAHRNQCNFEVEGGECRLGQNKDRPFSGVTACVDFCAHAHKDLHNMNNGSTVVVTLTKHRGFEKPDDEQLHVLPLYVLDGTDEFGSEEGQREKVRNGSLEVLANFPLEARMRAQPLTPKKRVKGGKKESPGAKKKREAAELIAQAQQAANNHQQMGASPVKEQKAMFENLMKQENNESLSFEDLMTHQNLPGFNELYGKFWDYFYANGTFPPGSFVAKWASNKMTVIKNQNMNNVKMENNKLNHHHPNHSNHPPNGQHPNLPPNGPHMNQPTNGPHPNLPPNGPHLNQSQNGPGNGPHMNRQPNGPHMNQPPNGQHPNVPPNGPHMNQQPNGQHPNVPPNGPHMNQQPNGQHPNVPPNGPHMNQLPNSLHSNQSQNSPHPNQPPHPFNSHHPHQLNGVLPEGNGQPGSNKFSSPLDMLSAAAMMQNGPGPHNPSAPPTQPVPSQPGPGAMAGPHSGLFTQPRPTSAPNSGPFNQQGQGPMGPFPQSGPPSGSFQPAQDKPHPSDHQAMQASSQPNSQETHSKDGQTFTNPQGFINRAACDPAGNFMCNGLDKTNCDPKQQNEAEPAESLLDPTVVKCEWQYNEEMFSDSSIGGVAIALSHGAVLFEVAKRELHATTALKNPNRYQPTRISLVFYQHKNLNYRHHGWYENERKMEMLRQKKLEKMKTESENELETPVSQMNGEPKTVVKKKKKKGVDFSKTSAAQYKYMWEAPVRHGISLTTDSIITRWIDPQPMVTGPYQRWV